MDNTSAALTGPASSITLASCRSSSLETKNTSDSENKCNCSCNCNYDCHCKSILLVLGECESNHGNFICA